MTITCMAFRQSVPICGFFAFSLSLEICAICEICGYSQSPDNPNPRDLWMTPYRGTFLSLTFAARVTSWRAALGVRAAMSRLLTVSAMLMIAFVS